MDQYTPNVEGCALVFEGGGYRCSYTAGMADVLLEEGIYFPLVAGISAGASNTVNYISQNRRRLRWALTTIAADPMCGGMQSALLGRGYYNGDHMYQGLIDCEDAPFDFEAFAKNKARLRIQAFRPDTGTSVIWDKTSMTSAERLVERVRASSAVPWMMRPDTFVDGKQYLDGGLGKGGGLPVHLAQDAGYKKFLFLATRPEGYVKEPFEGTMLALIKRLTRDDPITRKAILTRAERYNAERERIKKLEEAGACLTVRPDVMPVSSTTVDVEELERSFEMGRAQALRELPRWRQFLFGSPTAGPTSRPTTARPITGGPGYINRQ